MDDYSQLDRDRDLMKRAVEEAKERGLALARAESEYQTAKHVRVLELKDKGVPATIINLTIKGDPEVSGKLFERDCAKVLYDSANEAINTYKLDARLLEARIAREWNMGGSI